MLFNCLVSFHSCTHILLQNSYVFFLPPHSHQMARNSDFDRVWQQIVDEALEDNTNEEIMRYLCLLQQQPESNNRPRQTRRNINRNREDEHSRLMNNYFSENSTHMESQFRRRLQMQKQLFLWIVDALSNRYPYFQIRFDAFGRNGLSSLQKCTAKIHILAYGSPGYIVDGYVRISKSITVECLKSFVKGVNEIFGNNYLRRPNNNNINRLLQIGETHGFSCMLDFIDCMHWEWKNCPVSWQGQYCRGDHQKPTIIFEVVVS